MSASPPITTTTYTSEDEGSETDQHERVGDHLTT